MPNLPVIRSTGSSFGRAGSSSIGRAQQFSATNLGKESIKDASTSISHAGANSAPASSSVFHAGGQGMAASTSVAHPGMAPVSMDGGGDDAVRDRLRQQYIRKLMREKHAKAEAAAAAEQSHGYDMSFGGGFSKKKLNRTVNKEVLGHKSTYGSLVNKDTRKQAVSVLEKRFRQKTTGSAVTERDRRLMKGETTKMVNKGAITRTQKQAIDKLAGTFE